MNSSGPSPVCGLFSCAHCLRPYTNPKVLPCLHSFCETCLHETLPAQSFTLSCPACRQQFILPPSGISSFQSNPLPGALTTLGNGTDDTLALHESFGTDSDIVYCSSHPGQTLRFYCNECESAVCSSCTDMEHRHHQTVRLEAVALQHRQELLRIVELCERQCNMVEATKSQIATLVDVDRLVPLLKELNAGFDHLFEFMSISRQETSFPYDRPDVSNYTVDCIDNLYSDEMSLLSAIAASVRLVVKGDNPFHVILLKKQIETGALLCTKSPSAGNDGHTVSHMSTDELLQAGGFLPNTLHRQDSSNGSTAVTDLAVELAGAIVDSGQAVPSQPYQLTVTVKTSEQDGSGNVDTHLVLVPNVRIRGPLKPEETASLIALHELGNVTTSSSQISLSTFSDRSGGRCSTPSPTRRSSCPLHNPRAAGAVVRHNAGSKQPSVVGNIAPKCRSYTLLLHVRPLSNPRSFETFLSFPQPGKYEVDITFGDHDVPRHTLKVDVSRMKVPKRSASAEPQFLRGDSSLSFSSGRRSQTNRPSQSPIPCSLLESDDLLRVIGFRGRCRGQFTNPQDVCVTGNRVVATDSTNQCVQIFNADNGDFVCRFGDRGRQIGHLQRPTGVSTLPDSGGKLLVADYENRWISIFEPNGKFCSRLGTGKLIGPKGVAADGNGKIFVVDNKASCICIFQSNGKFVGRFGQQLLAGPHFVGINSFGHAYVSDFHSHSVKIFDSTGQLLHSFGSIGDGDGQFNAPTGIAIDPFDNVLVADWGNSRIQVFDRHGSYLQTIDQSKSPLYGPQGLALNAQSDKIFVADSGNHCIKVYEYRNWVTSIAEMN